MRPINRIIIHHSATEDSGTVSWKAIKEFHVKVRGWKDIGYHYGIERVDNGFVVLCGRPVSTPGAHTKGMNHDSIGVCLVGNYDAISPSDDALDLTARLVADLCNVHNLPINTSNIAPHSQFANKTCPGKKFSMPELIAKVALHALRMKNDS